jgi:dienelactone hydrolase
MGVGLCVLARLGVATAATMLLAASACAPGAVPVTSGGAASPSIGQGSTTFDASVAPHADEDLARTCTYELTLPGSARPVTAVWTIFERSRETRAYYEDADVRAFARRHAIALLFPRHCPSTSQTGGDMNVDPARGIGRALFAALDDLAQQSKHPELASARLVLLGFSGTGSLVARFAAFAPTRILAVIATNPGHFDPFGMDTIALPPGAAAIPHLVLVGSADAVSGTGRPYAYFRRHAAPGTRWTFVVQNGAPHCCILNAKPLILAWLEAVVQERTRSGERYGFIHTSPTTDTDCPGQSAPLRASWCRAATDAWGGANWSVAAATIGRSAHPPQGMLWAGWLPSEAFARQWVSFVTAPEHPVALPP